MYTNTDTKNQTRHMHRCKKWPEVFTRKGSTLHSLSQTGDKHSVMAAQKPCDPSSVLEYIVLTSWHPRNQSVPASWYNVIWHCHTRNLFQLPGTMSSDTVTQRIKSDIPNVIWHCHPRNQSVPASYRGAMSTVTTSHGMDPLWHLEHELWLTSSLWHLDDEQYWLVHSDILMRNSIN